MRDRYWGLTTAQCIDLCMQEHEKEMHTAEYNHKRYTEQYNQKHRRESDRLQDGKKDRRSKRGRQYRSRFGFHTFGEFLCAGRRDYDR